MLTLHNNREAIRIAQIDVQHWVVAARREAEWETFECSDDGHAFLIRRFNTEGEALESYRKRLAEEFCNVNQDTQGS